MAGETRRNDGETLDGGVRRGFQPRPIAARPSAFDQLVSLAFPFSAYEHAPFVSAGVPAVTITAHFRPARFQAFEAEVTLTPVSAAAALTERYGTWVAPCIVIHVPLSGGRAGWNAAGKLATVCSFSRIGSKPVRPSPCAHATPVRQIAPARQIPP